MCASDVNRLPSSLGGSCPITWLNVRRRVFSRFGPPRSLRALVDSTRRVARLVFECPHWWTTDADVEWIDREFVDVVLRCDSA
jgi:hypothetical protein